eukprot:Gb_02777 [translate_table: standard]
MTAHLIAHHQKMGILEVLLWFISPQRKGKGSSSNNFVECPEEMRAQLEHNWQIRLSFLLIAILDWVALPLANFGDWIEFLLNLFSHNGGLLKTLLQTLKWDVVMPKKGTDTYLSMIGHLDNRVNLNGRVLDVPPVYANVEAGSRFCADLCIMASKLVYENENVVKNTVTNNWKMHFVDFFNFWNENLQKYSTQAFIFCDKEVDAQLVVLAFRGTEPFNAYDWITDIDFSWNKLGVLGRVHLGFLEALGLLNRSACNNQIHPNSENNKDFSFANAILDQDPQNPLAYYTLCKRLTELLKQHKNAKFMVTGHSLGGALAALFPAILFLQEEEKLLEKLLAVYTFGQPRVGDGEFATFMDKHLNQPKPRYFRIVYSNDIVPRLPYDDHIFFFKHFGVCLYYDSCYTEWNLPEQPNKNYSLLHSVSIRLNAIWELVHSLVMPYTKGKEYRETWLSTAMRIGGILVPGVSAHMTSNYVNSVRLGPSMLTPILSAQKE